MDRPLLDNQLEEIEQTLNDYQAIPRLSGEEKRALHSLRLVFNEYKEKYNLTLKPQNRKLPASEIDLLVKVDDQPAITAIAILRKASMLRASQQEQLTEQSMQKTLFYVDLHYLLLPVLLLGAAVMVIYLRHIGRTNRALISTEERLNSIIESAPQPLMIINSEGRLKTLPM